VDLPDPVVGLPLQLSHRAEKRRFQVPGVVVVVKSGLPDLFQRQDDLPIDIELELPYRGVTDQRGAEPAYPASHGSSLSGIERSPPTRAGSAAVTGRRTRRGAARPARRRPQRPARSGPWSGGRRVSQARSLSGRRLRSRRRYWRHGGCLASGRVGRGPGGPGGRRRARRGSRRASGRPGTAVR